MAVPLAIPQTDDEMIALTRRMLLEDPASIERMIKQMKLCDHLKSEMRKLAAVARQQLLDEAATKH